VIRSSTLTSISILLLAMLGSGCPQTARVGDPFDAAVATTDDAAPVDDAPDDATRPPTCRASCDLYRDAGCIDAERHAMCAMGCGDPEIAPVIVECIAGAEGCVLPPGCDPDEEDLRSECASGCSELATFRCIAPSDAAECTARCDVATMDELERFVACTGPSICTDDSCYRILVPEGAAPDVTGCREACDRMHRWDCIEEFTHVACRDHCAVASAEPIRAFISCTERICDDGACYSVFRSAP
jgi:hypothetical protein